MRSLLPIWTIREVRTQYRQSVLDIGWSLLTPVILLAGYGVVLTSAFGVDGDGVPYIVFAWAGLILWTFVSNGLARAATSLVASAEIIRKVSFPKEVVPLATVLASGLDLVVGLSSLLVLMAVHGDLPDEHVVALVPVLLVAAVLTSAWGLALATVTAFVRDLAHGLGVILRIGIFVTPVMYPVSEVPPRFRWAVDTNPVAVLIEALRDCTLRGRWPDWSLLGAHAGAAALMFLLSLLYLRRVEGRIADVI